VNNAENIPELVTVAASFGPAATFMPASMMGWLMPKSFVRGVEKTWGEEGIMESGGMRRRLGVFK